MNIFDKKKNKEEDLPALKTSLTFRYNGSKTPYTDSKEDRLLLPDNTRANRMKIIRKQNGKRNNCVDVLTNK